jgi:hypothetical protein
VAEKLKLHFRTISYTRKAWLEKKFASLSDKPRCGEPLKIRLPEKSAQANFELARTSRRKADRSALS